jgi:hypothetical protein
MRSYDWHYEPSTPSGSSQLFFTAREDLFRAYEEFIEFRAERLAEQLNDFVGLGERRPGGQAAGTV